MGFQRATWHSGLTYRHVCNKCGQENIYMDDKLDFRPWYADGFIYCSKCNTPLRHNERLAIDGNTTEPMTDAAPAANTAPAAGTTFCTQCGKAFSEGDRFCAGCGKARD